MIPSIHKILYATDLGPGSPHVFRYALSLAQQYGASIEIVKAIEPLSNFAQALVELHVSRADTERHHRDEHDQVLAQIRRRLHDFCVAELSRAEEGEQRVTSIEVLEGQAFEVILDEARRISADMIVMGTHRHSVLGESLLGTTAQKVVHSSVIPVLLVRIPE